MVSGENEHDTSRIIDGSQSIPQNDNRKADTINLHRDLFAKISFIDPKNDESHQRSTYSLQVLHMYTDHE